jgi:ATP-dependent protease Clp ATPase subunit
MKSANGLFICDFCEKNQHQVEIVVKGLYDSAICNECIELCNEIVAERLQEKKQKGGGALGAVKNLVRGLRSKGNSPK